MNILIKILKSFRVLLLSLFIIIITYSLISFFGSTISTFHTQESKDVDIYILSNGVHTDIVIPSKNHIKDWTEYFPYKNTKSKVTKLPHLALGWGSKGFYLDTPTWNDLTFSTAFNAAFGLSESAIHATYYRNVTPDNELCYKLSLSTSQYENLCAYISNSLIIINNKSQHIKTDAVYGSTDAFYNATGSYNVFYTCNTWANNALKVCDQKAALWTPFDKGILTHYNSKSCKK